jgi:carbon monoxide dehydrogenase subunit G
MRTTYDAAVGDAADQVWTSLTDVDSVLAALPGAALARDGDAVSGSLKCKLGSSQVTYRVTARAETGAAEFHNAVIAVTGKEARGSGTLAATVNVAVRSEAAGSRVEVEADIEATGRGEAADDKAWRRVIELLVNAVLPQPATAPAPPPPSPRPPLAVAPQPVAPTTRRTPIAPIAVVVAAVFALLLLKRGRRRRHRRR